MSLDLGMTAAFALEVGGFTAALLNGYIPNGCPLTPRMAAMALLIACVIFFCAIVLVKRAFGAFGALISRHVSEGNPLGKRRTRTKFEDQSWQMAIHVAATAVEVYVIYYDGGGEPWFRDYGSLWLPHPREQVHAKTSLHALYLLQMAAWIVTCFSHRFLEAKHKDYYLMYTHHLVTIALVGLSYLYGYVRIGALVMLLHDSSDIVGDLLKMTNYLKLEGPTKLFLVEICFFTNLVTWAYARLYVYAVHVVWYSGWVAPREAHLAPNSPGMLKSDPTAGHADHFVWPSSIGDGSFDVFANIAAVIGDPVEGRQIAGYWALNVLMTLLLLMHWAWYLMFWRILYRLLSAETAHDVGRDEYEGDSDQED